MSMYSLSNQKKIINYSDKERTREILMIHGKRMQDGKPQGREDWHELVEAIKMTFGTIHHTQLEDVKIWMEQQTTNGLQQMSVRMVVYCP